MAPCLQQLIAVMNTTLLSMMGPGLALRGPDGRFPAPQQRVCSARETHFAVHCTGLPPVRPCRLRPVQLARTQHAQLMAGHARTPYMHAHRRSMHPAVEGMVYEYNTAYICFVLGLIAFHFSAALFTWLMFTCERELFDQLSTTSRLRGPQSLRCGPQSLRCCPNLASTAMP